MPTLTVFSPADYVADPTYPGQLELWLTTTPIPDSPFAKLDAYTEASFSGYRRAMGPRGAFLRTDPTGPEGGVADSKKIIWVSKESSPVSITGVLVVARFPGEPPQLVNVFPRPWTFTPGGPGMAFTFSMCPTKRSI